MIGHHRATPPQKESPFMKADTSSPSICLCLLSIPDKPQQKIILGGRQKSNNEPTGPTNE